MEKQVVKLNYLRMAPRKVRAVADLLRGLSVNEAEAQLMFQVRRPAKPLMKLLRSAVASAKAKGKLNMDKLYITAIEVNQGPMLKRYMARAQGRMAEIQKKMCHVTLTLAENPKAKTSRFKIVAEKKTKHLTHEENPKRKPKKEAMETMSSRPKESGFFKKVFQRNTGTKSSGGNKGGE
ncbi:MAG: 50S ribosomal protein L22 [Candidatus Liptonbacteria bacterium]|nr:50S ribosomal protein L22 [Candidatus Liptonbacteria bacterium]